MYTRYVYLIHFATPVAPERHTCQHYLGSAEDWRQRLIVHKSGDGARLTATALDRGIYFNVVRVWRVEEGQGRKVERLLKNRKYTPRLCPVCAGRRGKSLAMPALPGVLSDSAALPTGLESLPAVSF